MCMLMWMRLVMCFERHTIFCSMCDYVDRVCVHARVCAYMCIPGTRAPEPTQGQYGCKGLCESLSGLHVQIHLWQLSRTVQPAPGPGKRTPAIEKKTWFLHSLASASVIVTEFMFLSKQRWPKHRLFHNKRYTRVYRTLYNSSACKCRCCSECYHKWVEPYMRCISNTFWWLGIIRSCLCDKSWWNTM